MFIPLSLWEDEEKREHFHIVKDGTSLCGAETGDAEWHLPDEPFININLCLDCWERIAVEGGSKI